MNVNAMRIIGAAAALVLAALVSTTANAQAIRCEALAFANERMACFYYRASIAPGPSCLLCTPQQVHKPAKRVKHRRTQR